MATLDVFRPTVGAAALGFARRALDEALARASRRQLFGGPLAELQMIQAKLADMALAVDAAALLVYRAAWAKDAGAERITREAAMAKLYRHRGRAARDRRRGAAPRRARRGRRPSGRAAVSRDAGAAHLRGRLGGAEDHHRAPDARRARQRAGRERARPGRQRVGLREGADHVSRYGSYRHLRARQPAAARALAGVQLRPAGAAVSGAPELRHRAARPRGRARASATRPLFYTPERALDLRRAARAGEPDRPRAARRFGLVPGNRVLLRAANNPMLVACWFAVLKAGGIAVTTMPLLRARELAVIIDKAKIGARAVRSAPRRRAGAGARARAGAARGSATSTARAGPASQPSSRSACARAAPSSTTSTPRRTTSR